MVRLLEQCGVRLNETQLSKLWIYHQLIHKRNQEYNLTGLQDFKEIIIKHYVDCFTVSKLIDTPFPLLDIGSGAGLPGILFKILFPGEKIILAEPRKKRVNFLKEVKSSLDLKNTYIYPHKIKHDFKTRVQTIITRALETIPETLQRVSSCLEEGGLAVFMKGPSVDKEIELFKKSFNNEYSLVKNQAYVLPLINHKRRLVVLRRK